MLTGDTLTHLNNDLDMQAEYIELIEAANAGTLDSDEPSLLHIDEAEILFNSLLLNNATNTDNSYFIYFKKCMLDDVATLN